ncbi:MAG: hypothetical protein IPM23_20815 [Candidatus Melainabacteria bacterium]|nr:hypothetical protein [Candidatus Melainabacteria bacterium]
MNIHLRPLLACLALFFSVNTMPASAEVTEQLKVEGEVMGVEGQYQRMHRSFEEKLGKLEGLGGGIKPFADRLSQIDESFKKGDAQGAVRSLDSLDRSIESQLKSVTALRAPRPKAAPASQVVSSSSNSRISQNPLMILARSEVGGKSLISPETIASMNTGNYSSFQGSPNEYLEKLARDLVGRELGGLSIPVKGPFRLERFRNVQRISELRKLGKRVDNYLYQYEKTEDLAAQAHRDPGRVEELSSQVRYLAQQLGVSQLSGSLRQQSY